MKYLLVAMCLVVSGCMKPEVITRINALANPVSSQLKTYRIFSSNPKISDTNLQFIEYAQHLKKALFSQGYKEAKNAKDANVVIFFEYALSGPNTSSYTYEKPIYGTVETGSVTTSYSNSKGNVSGNRVNVRTTTTSETTKQTELGIIGSKTQEGTLTTYIRTISIRAIAITKPIKNNLWTLTTVSSGPSANMRTVVPTMIFAAAPYLGVSSGKIVEIKSDVYEPPNKQ